MEFKMGTMSQIWWNAQSLLGPILSVGVFEGFVKHHREANVMKHDGSMCFCTAVF